MTEYKGTYTYNVDCPDCGSPRTKKDGYQNKQQRHECKDCGKKFRYDDPYKKIKIPDLELVEGKQFTAEQIGFAIYCFYCGLSLKSIAKGFEFLWGIPEPSRNTIYEWICEYTDKADYALRDFKLPTSGHFVADEMMVRVGGGWAYCWYVMDAQTRCLLASHLSRSRRSSETIKTFEKALKVANKAPITITTDDYNGYPVAIRKLCPNAQHIVSEGIYEEINNNLSERLNNTSRSREKTLRGMDSIQSGQRYLNGWGIFYNLFREHWALKDQPPVYAAGGEPPFWEWADVVRGKIDVPESAKTKPVPRHEREVVEDNLRKRRREKMLKRVAERRERKRGTASAKPPRADIKRIPKMGKGETAKQMPLFPDAMMPKLPKAKKPRTAGRAPRKTRRYS